MISASIAETHRFGRVRKNGYDPAEVDAVVARLVDALRRNDERISTLTSKLDDADASADAIRNTFVAAESTRDTILAEAHSEAETITEMAKAEATELAALLESMQPEIAAARERALAAVFEDAERRMRELEQQAAERSADAAWAAHEAMAARNRAVSDAEADAAVKVRAASKRADALMARIESMDGAARQLEEAAATLAESAQQGAQVINISAIDQINELGENLLGTTPGRAMSATSLDESTSTGPHLGVAPPIEDDVRNDDEPKTRYQRSTGVPLRERIKIARMSG
ncbi:MAG: DivIVA domain-containing protein [Actinomycetota bacterium]